MITSRRKAVSSLLSLTVLGALRAKASGTKDLPRVFIIGDSISIGYTPHVVKALEGRASVSRPNQNCNGTKFGLEKLDEWLGSEKYDLIHFNFGLHDMKHVNPTTGDGSNNPADPRQSDLSTYKKNLEIIVDKLKSRTTNLIFATSTPVVGKSDRGVLREPEELTRYNNAATKIMRHNRVAINDLFSFAVPLVKDYQVPSDVHFTDEGYALLGREVAETIASKLHI